MIASPRSVERFRLNSPSVALDPRTHAYRADVADLALASLLFAPHYARAQSRGCAAVTLAVHAAPAADAPTVSELLHGEEFLVVDIAGDWAWGYCAHDGYVGYVACDGLGDPLAATHVVSTPAALVFAGPDIKAPVLARWPMGVRFAGKPESAFVALDRGFIHARHTRPLEAIAPDSVAVAERLIGAPYRWGGRSGDGIDCSGLVQLALGLTGVAAPRDSDQQEAALGRALGEDEPAKRGDIVFFRGHVGLMSDAETLVHANAHWMAVVAEPLADVVARGAAITSRRRLAA